VGAIVTNWRNLLKAKAKSQKNLDRWTDQNWGTSKQHKARAKGKKVPSKSEGDRYMSEGAYRKHSSTKEGKATLRYQDRKKKEGTEKGKQHVPTGKKFKQV
jgi:hypothetical protein